MNRLCCGIEDWYIRLYAIRVMLQIPWEGMVVPRLDLGVVGLTRWVCDRECLLQPRRRAVRVAVLSTAWRCGGASSSSWLVGLFMAVNAWCEEWRCEAAQSKWSDNSWTTWSCFDVLCLLSDETILVPNIEEVQLTMVQMCWLAMYSMMKAWISYWRSIGLVFLCQRDPSNNVCETDNNHLKIAENVYRQFTLNWYPSTIILFTIYHESVRLVPPVSVYLPLCLRKVVYQNLFKIISLDQDLSFHIVQ